MCKSKYKSVICNKVSIPLQSYGTSLLYIFPAMHGLCERHCSWMTEGLVNLFNMENISWGRYLYLTALLSLYHIWQQTTPCRLCSPCPFFHFFFCCSFLFPFISTIVHHHWPSEPTRLSHLIISNSKRHSSTLHPLHLPTIFHFSSRFLTLCVIHFDSFGRPMCQSDTRLLPSQWATVKHPGSLTVSFEGVVGDVDWRTYGNKQWLQLVSSPVIFFFCKYRSHLASVKWE